MCYLVKGTQKHLVMTAVHNFDFVSGAVLACVGLGSQVGAAAGWSASHLLASSQSCQQVGGQLTCLPPTPPACSHKPTFTHDRQRPFGKRPSRGTVRRPR